MCTSLIWSITGIDYIEVKYNILEEFVTFAKKMNCEFIAEGIETEAELQRVIDLGIDYGEGFFYCKTYPIPSIIETAKQYIDFFELKSRSVTIDISDKMIIGN
jgi:EAL domain-containing protein (putative c-di-GMP-specific phosphodiesterase class I)